MAFLGVFMIYPLIDVFVYSFEEGYNSASQTFSAWDFIIIHMFCAIRIFAGAEEHIFAGHNNRSAFNIPCACHLPCAKLHRKTEESFPNRIFLPYVTNTLAVGLVFMILFKKTPYTEGLVNLMINWFGGKSVDFISGPYWAKMFVLSFYTVWIVMPFKVLILTSALASVDETYYNAARIDGATGAAMFTRITLPMISPMIFYLVITGFIGAFKAYSDAVALFGTDLNAAGMNTIVGYIYDMLYGNSGGYPSFASAAAILLLPLCLP